MQHDDKRNKDKPFQVDIMVLCYRLRSRCRVQGNKKGDRIDLVWCLVEEFMPVQKKIWNIQ